MRTLLTFILISFGIFADVQRCYFIPPSGWEIAQLRIPSPHVKIGFIGKGSTEFRPSINLATEEVDVSLKEYIKAVKEIHMADPTIKWRDLGKLNMQGGTGRLIEMSNTSAWGDIKILQAIFIQKDTAYILTAAVLKEDFSKFQAELFKSFKSLDILPELWTPISNVEVREQFHQFFTKLGQSEEKNQEWEKLQADVSSLSQLGPYWQFLALTEGRAKIFPSENKGIK